LHRLATGALLGGVRNLADRGFITGASGRNWAGYGSDIGLPAGFADIDQALLIDPQTSCGLLVSCSPAALGAVMAVFVRHGFAAAAAIGEVRASATDQKRLILRQAKSG